MITTTAKMSHRALQLSGTNLDKILALRAYEDSVNPHRRAELAIAKIKKIEKRKTLY